MGTLRKAERRQASMRVGLSGPSGSGKSIGALKLAHGIEKDWTKIAVIDTENGSGDLYSHLGDYNILTLLPPYSPERFIEAIHECEEAGMSVIIIDSVTHEWDGKGGCLESNDLLAQTKFKGNTWSAWSVTTPRHQKFIDAITSSKCHIITTARSKTDTIQTEDKKIKKVGLKDIQREGFEYELTLSFNVDREGHYSTASKDRTGLFIDRDPFVITEATGKEIAEWNASGVDPEMARQELAGLLHDEIAGATTIEELKEAFEHVKSASKEIGQDRTDNLSAFVKIRRNEITPEKAPEDPVPEEEHHEVPEEEPGAGDIAAMEDSRS